MAGVSQAAVITVADPAADYLAAAGGPNAALAAPPTGWSYFGSTVANGGTEAALAAGQVGNVSAAYEGFVGVSGNNVAAVYGTNTASSAEFEIFANGQANAGVVGTDILLHPGDPGGADDYVILRFTVGDDGLYIAGTGTIAGSFREGIIGGGASAQSVIVGVYQNSTSLFTATGGTTAASTASELTQADGTFSLSGLTFATGDTIDFYVGANGNNGADETALNALIQVDTVPEPSSVALLGLGAAGLMIRRRRA